VIEPKGDSKDVMCEIAAGAALIDKWYFLGRNPRLEVNANELPNLFYSTLLQDVTARLVIDSRGSVSHDSVETWSHLRRKILWRIRNAVDTNRLSEAGLRSRHLPKAGHSLSQAPRAYHKLKERGFLLYVACIFPAVVDTVFLMTSRRNWQYWHHLELSLFTVAATLWMFIKYRLLPPTQVKRYGE